MEQWKNKGRVCGPTQFHANRQIRMENDLHLKSLSNLLGQLGSNLRNDFLLLFHEHFFVSLSVCQEDPSKESKPNVTIMKHENRELMVTSQIKTCSTKRAVPESDSHLAGSFKQEK